MGREKAIELLEQAERCIRPPSSFCEKAHSFVMEALTELRQQPKPTELTRGLRLLVMNHFPSLSEELCIAIKKAVVELEQSPDKPEGRMRMDYESLEEFYASATKALNSQIEINDTLQADISRMATQIDEQNKELEQLRDERDKAYQQGKKDMGDSANKHIKEVVAAYNEKVAELDQVNNAYDEMCGGYEAELEAQRIEQALKEP